MCSVRSAFGPDAVSGPVPGSGHCCSLVIAAASAQRRQPESPAALRRCHCPRHGQGTRRSIRQRGRSGAGGQSSAAKRQPNFRRSVRIRADPVLAGLRTDAVRIMAATTATSERPPSFRTLPACSAGARQLPGKTKPASTLARADRHRGVRGGGSGSDRHHHRSAGEAQLPGPHRRTVDPDDILWTPTTSEEQPSQSTSVSTPPVASMPPPLVTGPDQSGSHAVCDQGFQFPNATGFGTQAGRGTPQTSCYFAHSVLLAYWNTYGNASPAARTVSAPGYVACSTVPGANCDPKNTTNFLMQCAGDGSNPWIKCTGGEDAIVYLW